MNGAITYVGMRVLVILGYLVGAADTEAMISDAAVRVLLVLLGAVVTAFLFYVALRGARRRSYSEGGGAVMNVGHCPW